MATLSIRPRRTKDNRYPASQGPLARWILTRAGRPDVHVALRADGSLVRRIGHAGWNAYEAFPNRKGNTIEACDEHFTGYGYVRVPM